MKFLFCSLSSPGFLFPCIGIALKLQEQGHTVAFVTDIDQSEQLARVGLNRIPFGPQDGTSFQVPSWFQLQAIATQFKHVFYAIHQFHPDVVVAQPLTIGPMITAEIKRLPLAIIGFCTYLWLGFQPDPEDMLSVDQQRKAWRYGDMLKFYNQARQLLSLPPSVADYRGDPFLGDMFLLRSVPEFVSDRITLPEKVHLVGHCLWEEKCEDSELDAWLEEGAAAGAPIVYVQHGRFFDRPSFWPNLVSGLGNMNVRVVASMARMDHAVGELPANFFVRPHIPELRVLGYSDAMIASANSTAVLGALSTGAPSVLIPAGGEQPDVAAVCKAAGVARVLAPEQCSPGELCAALQQVMNDKAMKITTHRMARAFAQMDSFSIAAHLLNTLGSTAAPVLRSQAGCRFNEVGA